MMHYGAILAKGEVGYTNLDRVFAALGNIQENYNWLITDCECNVDIPELQYNYCWMSGNELMALQRKYHNPQWIWAVLSAFDKTVTEEQALEYPLPNARDNNNALWRLPVEVQNPLARFEIVPFDSSYTLLISREKEIVDRFRAYFPLSEDLEAWCR